MKTIYLFFIGCCLTIAASYTANAQPGSLDNTFGTGGKVTTTFGTADDYGNSVAIQSDGKIVVAGISKPGTNFDFALVRYNSDGTLDNTFGTSGKVTTDFGGADDRGNSVAIQLDGKIVVAGQTNADYALVRYNSNGTLDNTFGSSGKVVTDFSSNSDYGNSVILQPDGKIIVGGQSVGNNWDFSMARYTSNGTLDNTFGISGKITMDFHLGGYSYDYGGFVTLQPNGKILLAGSAYDTVHYFGLLRYNSNGSVDNTFGTGGKVCMTFGGSDLEGRAVAVQADNKIVMAGWSNIGVHQAFALARFDTIGNLDNTFGTGGKVTTVIGTANAGAYSMVIQADGKIILAGHSYNYYDDFTVVRYNSDGSLDNTFGSSGKVVTNFANHDDGIFGIALQGDGKIVVAGNSYNGSNLDIALARYNAVSTTDIEENNQETGINIFPNPNNGTFAIQAVNGQLSIYNILGENVYRSEIKNKKSEIDLSKQPKGIYFVKIFDGEKVYSKKIIVQ